MQYREEFKLESANLHISTVYKLHDKLNHKSKLSDDEIILFEVLCDIVDIKKREAIKVFTKIKLR